MYNSASSNRYYTEGILHITGKGEILDTTQQALGLLALSNPNNSNLFKDYIFLDNNDYTSIAVDKISSKNVSYIIKTVSKKKSKYILATFKQTEDKENYIVSLYDNSELIEKILEFKKQEYLQRLLVSSINDIIFEVNKDGIFFKLLD